MIKRTYHGLTGHPLQDVWQAAKQRCFNPNNKNFHQYGGRGITMCEEWASNLKKFHDFCMDNGWEHGLEVDRIDNDGDYEPSNIRFVERVDNVRNRQKTLFATINGVKKPISEWVEEMGVSYTMVTYRIRNGYTPEDALLKPVKRAPILLTYNGETHNIREWERKMNVNQGMFYHRYKAGWSTEAILTTPLDESRSHRGV